MSNFYPIYGKNIYGYIVNVYIDIGPLNYIQDIRILYMVSQ